MTRDCPIIVDARGRTADYDGPTAFGDRRMRWRKDRVVIVVIFMLGIGNFALHKAVLESGHPLLGRMPWFVHMLGGKVTMITEFLVLLAAMLLAAEGWPALVWAYLVYSLLNAFSAWLILTDRI